MTTISQLEKIKQKDSFNEIPHTIIILFPKRTDNRQELKI